MTSSARRLFRDRPAVLPCVASAILLAAASNLVAQSAPVCVAFDAGARHVVVSTATTGALHVHVTVTTNAPPRRSVFLAPAVDNGSVPCQLTRPGDTVVVKSVAGKLVFNSRTNRFTLENARGRLLIADAALADSVPALGAGQTYMSWTLTRPRDANITVYGSGDQTDGLQQVKSTSRVGNGVTSVPYYWSASGYAALMLGDDDNRPASWALDAGQNAQWSVPGRTADLYLMPAANLIEAAERYAELTGPAPVPPRWTFGYLQSRWGWTDSAYIDATLKRFTDDKLPLDAFIFDFEWFTPTPDYSLPPQGRSDYHDFTWNPLLFPHPAEQVAAMHAQGVHVVAIRKPRVGNSDVITDFHQKDWILDAAQTGTDARALDYSKPPVRDWYAAQLEPLLKAGIDGWWDDEGEATFTSYTYWNQSEAQALAAVNPAGRLWTIDRAFQPGLQRYGAAAWTGDIASTWASLARTPTKLLNWSLAGMPYAACDIGGFTGEDTPELLTRWMQAGVFFPVMRSHSTNRVQPRFPWLYGADAEANIRKALELRYRLIPMYYSLAHETFETGTPMMRPLVMVFPGDAGAANITSQWMIGSNLMAAPVLEPGTQRSVYLPEGVWYPLDSNTQVPGGRTISVAAGMDRIPVYVRAGTILPLAPPVLHTDQLPGGPLQVQVYPGQDATFTLVEDDGKTTAYQKGQTRRTTFRWDNASRTLSWKIEGAYAGKDIFRQMHISVFDPGAVATANSALASSGQLRIPRK